MKAYVEGLRWRTRPALTVAALSIPMVLLGAACSTELEHGYVHSADGSLSFRYPSEWQSVDLKPEGSEWIAGVDASDSPAEANLDTMVLDQPFVVAQVYPLDPSSRDEVSLGSLRTLALNDRRDPAADGDPTIRMIFNESFLDDSGFEGHHMRFEVDFAEGTAIEEHFAVFDPERIRVQRVRVACSVACFEAHAADIESLFSSVRLRK